MFWCSNLLHYTKRVILLGLFALNDYVTLSIMSLMLSPFEKHPVLLAKRIDYVLAVQCGEAVTIPKESFPECITREWNSPRVTLY